MEVGTLNVEGRRAGTVFRGVERKKQRIEEGIERRNRESETILA
jgi:hypothetical protein